MTEHPEDHILETELRDGSVLVTDLEALITVHRDRVGAERAVATWRDRDRASKGHARSVREFTAGLTQQQPPRRAIPSVVTGGHRVRKAS